MMLSLAGLRAGQGPDRRGARCRPARSRCSASAPPLGIVVQAAGAVPGAAPGRLRLALAVGLPPAAPARARPGQRLDARLRRGEPDRAAGRAAAGPDRLAPGATNAAGPLIFNNAFLIFMMAHGIIAVSIITALMPRMAAAAAENRHRRPGRPAVAGHPADRGRAGPGDRGRLRRARPAAGGEPVPVRAATATRAAIATGWVIAVAGLGLVPFAISQLQLFAFYAMPDTRTPALVNIPVVALRIAVDLLLFVVLPAAGVGGRADGRQRDLVRARGGARATGCCAAGSAGSACARSCRTLTRLGLAALVACVPTVHRGGRHRTACGTRPARQLCPAGRRRDRADRHLYRGRVRPAGAGGARPGRHAAGPTVSLTAPRRVAAVLDHG